MATAQDQAGGRNHAIGALLACQPRIFLDAVDRNFGSAPEHRKDRAVFQEIDGVIAPFAVGNHSPVQIENAAELETIERYPARQCSGGTAFRRTVLAWVSLPRH